MKEFAKSYDQIDWVVRLLLSIFFGWIVGGVYRICTGHVIAGILWLLTAGWGFIGWIIDVVSIILKKKIIFFA